MSVAVVGDLGLANAGATFDRLHQLVEDNEIDFVLHLGDIGCEKSLFGDMHGLEVRGRTGGLAILANVHALVQWG